MLELFSLKQKVAVVTGASRGLGKPMAMGLAAAGAHVALVARDADKLNAVRDEIVAAGGEATVVPIDLADEAAIRAGVRRRLAGTSAASISASTMRASSTGSRCSKATWTISSASWIPTSRRRL